MSGHADLEIPGADIYLGLDKEGKNIYYLTTKKMANMANDCKDPMEARFSSPTLVKKISIEKLKALKELVKTVHEHYGTPSFSQLKTNDFKVAI